MLYKKGKLVFTEELQEHRLPSGIAYFSAKAIVVATENGKTSGSIETLQISDLILKQARVVTDGTNSIEAHKLYTWPARLGDNDAWAESKRIFLEQHVMNFPIEILSVDEDLHPTWAFITPEQFKKFPADMDASPAFQQYLDEQSSYFFLRKDRNDPV